MPRQTGQTLVSAGAPKRVEQPQKIFESVRSWQWTSRPMTGSYSMPLPERATRHLANPRRVASRVRFAPRRRRIIASAPVLEYAPVAGRDGGRQTCGVGLG